MYCPKCNVFINDASASVCPHCGSRIVRKKEKKRISPLFVVILVLVALVGVLAAKILDMADKADASATVYTYKVKETAPEVTVPDGETVVEIGSLQFEINGTVTESEPDFFSATLSDNVYLNVFCSDLSDLDMSTEEGLLIFGYIPEAVFGDEDSYDIEEKVFEINGKEYPLQTAAYDKDGTTYYRAYCTFDIDREIFTVLLITNSKSVNLIDSLNAIMKSVVFNEKESTATAETKENPFDRGSSTFEKSDLEGFIVREVSVGEKNALRSAKNYLRVSAFSREGLIDQLEFEGYTYAEAVYGVDNCGADWYEQAAECAEDYLKISGFSKQGLIDQLEFEGFTKHQAEHGARMVGY